ncbi:MAG: dual specificity protein phosphatase family protein, partial [Hydrogenophaga sp.]|uniref:phosphatase domain-containing putative toxin n=1 Tax=Hydrogenophaga sp. TaxID=1904254 RepID=UPI002611A7F0
HGLGTLAQRLNQPLIEQTRAHQRAITILSHALSQPALLMIDEPTYGLTDDEAGWLVQWLKSLGSRQRLLVVLHHQKQARALADRIILLGGGRILAHQDTYRFFTNSGNAWVEQFLRSGSLPIASPDAQPEHLDPGVPPPPPLSDPARQALAAAQTPAAAPAPPAPSAPPAATAAPAVRPRATLPPLSPQGVSTAALVGTAAPPDSRGPNGFHWIVPGKLAGTAEPGLSHSIDYDLDLLARIGVTHLISLTEKDLDQEALGRHGLQNIHLPVFDRETPSIAQTYMLLRRMQKLLDEGKVVAVHCKAGIGRTGTVLAAWMIREGGLSTSSAIERLRLINKSYVQTEMQENFLHAFEADMLMRL